MYTNGEMAKLLAEIVHIKLKHPVIARSCGYLVIVGQMVIHLFNIVLLRERVAHTLQQFSLVMVIIEQHGISLPPVTACTSCLLKIGLHAVWTVNVNHQSHIGLVNTHSKSIRRHHHTYLIVQPCLLTFILHRCIKPGMIESGSDSCAIQPLGILFRTATTANIDN